MNPLIARPYDSYGLVFSEKEPKRSDTGQYTMKLYDL